MRNSLTYGSSTASRNWVLSASQQQLRDQHAEEHRIFTNHVNMDDALKTQFLDAVEDPYVSELCNRYTGYMGVTTRDLLDHLMDRYGNIMAADLKSNEARINEELDNTRPINAFFNASMMPYSMPMTEKTHLWRIKYYRQPFTPSTAPACIERHARNGARMPTKTKRGQISSATLPLSIMRYGNNSAYRETPASTVQISLTRQRIWRRHWTIWH